MHGISLTTQHEAQCPLKGQLLVCPCEASGCHCLSTMHRGNPRSTRPHRFRQPAPNPFSLQQSPSGKSVSPRLSQGRRCPAGMTTTAVTVPSLLPEETLVLRNHSTHGIQDRLAGARIPEICTWLRCSCKALPGSQWPPGMFSEEVADSSQACHSRPKPG